MTVSELTPMMRLSVQHSDTKEILNAAIALAEEHEYYKLKANTPERFAEFFRPDERIPKDMPYGKVQWKSWVGYFRFYRCLQIVRETGVNNAVNYL